MKEDFLSEIKEDDPKDLLNSRQGTMFSPEVSEEFENEYDKKRMKYIKSDPYKVNIFSKLLSLHGFDINFLKFLLCINLL